MAVDISGLLGAYAQLGAARRHAAEVERQEELRREAESTAQMQAMGTAVGAAIGFGVGGPTGAALGASLGRTAGTVAAGDAPTAADIQGVTNAAAQAEQVNLRRDANAQLTGSFSPEADSAINREFNLGMQQEVQVDPRFMQQVTIPDVNVLGTQQAEADPFQIQNPFQVQNPSISTRFQ